jgi:hypothetical protein
MHNAPILTALVLAVAFAGCSDGGSDDATAPMASSSSSSTTGPPPAPVVTSDTLHLLAPPTMALVLPEGSPETATGTAQNLGPGGGGGGAQEPAARWTFQVGGNSTVTAAEIHVWVEIKDTLLQPLDPRDPQDTCTWIAVLELGADGSPAIGCLSEPPGPINPGTKELIFDLLALDGGLEANETITFTFQRRAFSASPDDSVLVLSGSSSHDSRLVLQGLKEAVPDA